MELSQEVCNALRLLGNLDTRQEVSSAEFKTVIEDAIADLLQRGVLEQKKTTAAIKGSLAGCQSGFCVLLVEAARRNYESAVVTATLEDLGWGLDRIGTAVKCYEKHGPLIQRNLASMIVLPPHVVNVDWRLDHHLKNSTGVGSGEVMYLITLYTQAPGDTQDAITFSCSLSHLNQLITSLRQASRCLQRHAVTQS